MSEAKQLTIEVTGATLTMEVDEFPDVSHLGEYCDSDKIKRGMKQGEDFIDMCQDDSDIWDWRNYRYYIPMNSYEGHFKSLHEMGYSKGMADYLARSYVRQDFNRMETFNENDWCMLIVQVEIDMDVSDSLVSLNIDLSSGFLGGVESDGGADYHREIISEQLDIALADLTKLGLDFDRGELLESLLEQASNQPWMEV